MVPARSIVSPSRESKSTSQSKLYWAHQRGLESESRVIAHYVSKGCELLGQRIKTPFAEVDLLFKNPKGDILMVEVKTANISEFQQYRISWKQKRRLLRALTFLSDETKTPIEVHWAFVTKEGQVTIIDDVSGAFL